MPVHSMASPHVVRDALIWALPIPTAIEVTEEVPQPPPGMQVPGGAAVTTTSPCCCTTAGLGGFGNFQYVLLSTTTIVVPLVTDTVVPSSRSVSWIVPDRGAGRVVAVVVAVCLPTVVGVVAPLDEVSGERVVLVVVTIVEVVASVLVAVPAPQPADATTTNPVTRAAIGRRLITVMARVATAAGSGCRHLSMPSRVDDQQLTSEMAVSGSW